MKFYHVIVSVIYGPVFDITVIPHADICFKNKIKMDLFSWIIEVFASLWLCWC